MEVRADAEDREGAAADGATMAQALLTYLEATRQGVERPAGGDA
jgi:hypothetical protein